MDKQAAKFFMGLLNAATVAHILHLQTKSFAQHMALDELYKALPDLADAVIEAYQGKYGIVGSYPATISIPKDPLEFITDLSSFISTYRDICEDTEIQNLIDEVAGQVDSTMYKLKFLS